MPAAKLGDWLRRIQEFQEALLPHSATRTAYCDVAVASQSGKGQLSGDYCDAVVAGDLDAFVMGDVTGHGLPSALVVAVMYGATREALRFTASPCRILAHLHELLAGLGERAGGPRLFSASLFVATIDADGVLTYANAGHPSPLLLRAHAKAEPLVPTTPPIGLVAPEPCELRSVRLARGHRVLLYSDGILPHGAGPEDVREEVDRLGDAPTEQVVRHLVGDGVADDRTVMMVTYRGR